MYLPRTGIPQIKLGVVVGVGVNVLVGVIVGVGVFVTVFVGVTVCVTVGVTVFVGVGVGVSGITQPAINDHKVSISPSSTELTTTFIFSDVPSTGII